MRFLLLAIFILWGTNSAALSLETRQLMENAEKGLSQSKLLEARFHQKTTMPFMDVALESEGKFCFDINEPKNPVIFWEYQQPDISGFYLEKGKAAFWTAKSGKTLSDSEMKSLKGMTDQIIQWINFNPEQLLAIYDVTQLGPRSLKFEPKEESRLFKAIEFILSEDMLTLDQLAFHGQNGEITTLKFNVEKLNQPLPPACRR